MPYFRYRIYWADGDEAGEAEYVERIKPGETVWLSSGQRVRVTDVIENGTDDGFVGLVRVEMT